MTSQDPICLYILCIQHLTLTYVDLCLSVQMETLVRLRKVIHMYVCHSETERWLDKLIHAVLHGIFNSTITLCFM